MTALPLQSRALRDVWDGPAIDVDVHAEVPSVDVLLPYLAPVWHQHIRERGFSGPSSFAYPPGLTASAAPRWRPPDGRKPASDVSLLREHVLDAGDVELAIVNCYYAVDQGHPDFAGALASAVNDWLIAEWLDRDPRLRASIVVPGDDPTAMIAEIDRVGDHPGFVQVLMPVRSGQAYGKRSYFPVYEAMARHRLVMGLHWGGSNAGRAPTPSGFPSWYVEEYVAEQQVYEAQLVSLIAGGAFQAVPELRVTFLESGFAWLPSWMWRMDKEWKGMRREIPWVNRAPFQIVRDHMRFSVAPLDAGPVAELARIIGWLRSEDLLLYATDYPHLHDDDLQTLLDAAPESMRPRIMAGSARDWYRL